MNKLYLDTSTSSLLLSIISGEREETIRLSAIKRSAEVLFPYIEESLMKLGIKFNNLEEVYVTNGPGSYTGSRIGVTLAKVLLVLNPNIKVYMTTSLKALTFNNDKCLGLIDARNNAFFSIIKNESTSEIYKRLELSEVRDYHEKGYEILIYEGDERSKESLKGIEVKAVDVLNNMMIMNDYISIDSYDQLKPIYLQGEGR